MDGRLDGWMTDRRQKAEQRDGWMNRMGFPAETDGRQKQEGRIGKEETAKRKQDRENRNEELGIRKKTMNEKLGLRFRKTWDIIEAVDKGLLPDKVMLNVHPQRWDDRLGPWVKELVWQNVKNVVKRYFYVRR